MSKETAHTRSKKLSFPGWADFDLETRDGPTSRSTHLISWFEFEIQTSSSSYGRRRLSSDFPLEISLKT